MINLKSTLLAVVLFTAFFTLSTSVDGQTIQRSTLTASGSSKLKPNAHYLIKQSVGQSSITGTVRRNNTTLIQGFIQPKLAEIKTSPIKELEVVIESNPFSDSYNIVLRKTVAEDLNVSVYNIMGQKIYSEKIYQSNEFEINLGSHAIGCYILCIQTSQKQFTTKLIKK